MCHQINTIAKNYNGDLCFCENCQLYRLVFNNICIEFNEKELLAFQSFVSNVEVEYWEAKYDRIAMKRKIHIQSTQQNLSLLFNRQEFASLKELVLQKTKKPFTKLSLMDIDYTYFLN